MLRWPAGCEAPIFFPIIFFFFFMIKLCLGISFCIWPTELESGISRQVSRAPIPIRAPDSFLIGISCSILLTLRSTTIEHQLKFLVPRIMRVYRARCHTELDDSRAQYTQGHRVCRGGEAHQYRARKRSIFTVKIEEQKQEKK